MIKTGIQKSIYSTSWKSPISVSHCLLFSKDSPYARIIVGWDPEFQGCFMRIYRKGDPIDRPLYSDKQDIGCTYMFAYFCDILENLDLELPAPFLQAWHDDITQNASGKVVTHWIDNLGHYRRAEKNFQNKAFSFMEGTPA